MKIPKEQIFIFTVGLFLLSYLLEAVVEPLKIRLVTPYAYLSPLYFAKYPFTTAAVLIRGLSLFMAPLLIMSFFPKGYFTKVGILLVASALLQLYALQEVSSGTTLITLEWSLSITFAGACLVFPAILFALKGIFHSAKEKFSPEQIPLEATESEE